MLKVRIIRFRIRNHEGNLERLSKRGGFVEWIKTKEHQPLIRLGNFENDFYVIVVYVGGFYEPKSFSIVIKSFALNIFRPDFLIV